MNHAIALEIHFSRTILFWLRVDMTHACGYTSSPRSITTMQWRRWYLFAGTTRRASRLMASTTTCRLATLGRRPIRARWVSAPIIRWWSPTSVKTMGISSWWITWTTSRAVPSSRRCVQGESFTWVNSAVWVMSMLGSSVHRSTNDTHAVQFAGHGHRERWIHVQYTNAHRR